MNAFFKLDSIEPNRRLAFSSESIEKMKSSISINGQLDPITIHQHNLSFRIIDGEKRWRAMKKLGRPVILAELENDQ